MNFFIFFVFALVATITAFPTNDVNWETVVSAYVGQEPLSRTPLNVTRRESKGRITFGTPVTSMSAFGYQLGLLTASSIRSGRFWCGASIISATYGVTAAHCFYKATTGFVYVGCLDRSQVTGGCKRYEINEDNYEIHSGYDNTKIANDIALLRFPVTLDFTDSIYPIALNTNPNIQEGTNCVISGWGVNEKGTQPNILATANVKIISESVCRQYFNVGPSQICQGVTKAVGVCQGDSGGPITMKSNGKPLLIGLTSFGSAEGCVNDLPRVFVNVAYYGDFIRHFTGIVG